MPLQGFTSHSCRGGLNKRNVGWKQSLEVFGPIHGLDNAGLLPALDQISHSFVWPSLENLWMELQQPLSVTCSSASLPF